MDGFGYIHHILNYRGDRQEATVVTTDLTHAVFMHVARSGEKFRCIWQQGSFLALFPSFMKRIKNESRVLTHITVGTGSEAVVYVITRTLSPPNCRSTVFKGELMLSAMVSVISASICTAVDSVYIDSPGLEKKKTGDRKQKRFLWYSEK